MSYGYYYVEPTIEDRLVKMAYSRTVGCIRGRGRPRNRWIDVAKELIRAEDTSDEDCRGLTGNRMQWKQFV